MIRQRTPLRRSNKPIARTPVKKRRSKPRRGPLRDENYKAWIRTLPCLICYRLVYLHLPEAAVESAQFRSGESVISECAHVGVRGLGQKSSDRETVPLCSNHHQHGDEAHHVLGRNFWKHHKLDRKAVTKKLNALYELERAA